MPEERPRPARREYRSIGPDRRIRRRKDRSGLRIKGTGRLLVLLVMIGAVATFASGALTESSRSPANPDQGPEPIPLANPCAVVLTDGAIDPFWFSPGDTMEGFMIDPLGDAAPPFDIAHAHPCNDPGAGLLIFNLNLAAAADTTVFYHVVLDTSSPPDMVEDYSIMLFLFGPPGSPWMVGLWDNTSGAWTGGPLPGDLVDNSSAMPGPFTFEVGVPIAAIGSPDSIVYYVRDQPMFAPPDLGPPPPGFDRMPDLPTLWGPPFTGIPEMNLLPMAIAVSIIALPLLATHRLFRLRAS